MHRQVLILARVALGVVGVLATSCSAAPTSSQPPTSSLLAPAIAQPSLGIASQRDSRFAFQPPGIIAVDGDTGQLESWPLTIGGSSNPTPISAPLGISGSDLAAHGNVIAIAPSQADVILYDVSTGSQTTLPDPFGSTIGVAIDKNENIFAMNSESPQNDTVVMYPKRDRQHPRNLSGCGFLRIGSDIAADNEGDIFVAGLTQQFASRVIEFPNGPNGPDPTHCAPLALKPSGGFSGLAIDPKTDDLVTLDNPDECAGGLEGRMIVYPKPYQKATGKEHDLGANCSGGMRLSADSSKVFIGDEDVSGSFTFILQRSFPDGANEGAYMEGQPEGFTTIPNSLPN